MKDDSILYISTNSSWGGSEILWSESASLLIARGYKVTFAVNYRNDVTDSLVKKGGQLFDLTRSSHVPVSKRVLQKVGVIKRTEGLFGETFSKRKPGFIIISQGNNVDGNSYMLFCRKNKIPYVTITQLVTELLLTFINDDVINLLRVNYKHALVNFFVSQANLRLHNLMLGEELPNSKLVHNPFTVTVAVAHDYPTTENDWYHVAFVGRLETNHKGLDILFEVLSQDKWKTRQVRFSLYGSGPHIMLLKRLKEKYGLENVLFQGHTNSVQDVWQEHHLLVLPSRMEGQSLALIEAMWCYRAAVVTNVGGAAELVDDNVSGFIAEYPSARELDKALERAWENRDRWEAMGQKAGEKIREIYKELPVVSFTNQLEKLIKDN